MGKGGARTKSGPPPDPNALRRDRDKGEWTILPAEGRAGDPPQWPLAGQSEREAELWVAFWRKPQALAWERLGLEYEVGLYVRNLALAEAPGAPVNLGTLVRQMADSLGLTVPGLRSNRWVIARDEVADKRAEPAKATRRSSSKTRLKIVNGADEDG